MSRVVGKSTAASIIALFFPIIVSAANQTGHSMLAEDCQRSSQLGSLSIPFIVNQGQTDKSVAAYARTFGGTVFVTTDGEIVYSLPQRGREKGSVVLKERLHGAKLPKLTWKSKSPTRISCFRGKDPSKWGSDLPTYEVVDFGEIYEGIELKLRAYGNNVEKLFFVKPGVDPRKISIKVDGGDALRIDSEGRLEIETSQGKVFFTKPLAYQQAAGQRTYVDAAYDVKGDCYGFEVGEHDRSQPLIIDPLLASTYLGGESSENEEVLAHTDVAVASDGGIFVTGVTFSSDFPTTSGAYDDSLEGDWDVFISKFDDDLTSLVASTFLGGAGREEFLSKSFTALDESGNIYVTGTTFSSDFPTTTGAYDTGKSGECDVFVSRLSGDLTTLLASTYLGGDGWDYQPTTALDGGGNVFVAGKTTHPTFPTVPGAYDQTYNGGESDFFVAKLNGDLSSLVASTFLGGIYHELWPSVALAEDGAVYVAGSTGSYDYPVTPTAYDTSFNGSHAHGQWNLDVCISKLDGDLSSLLASSFVGSEGYEGCLLLCLDQIGNIYVNGHVTSSSYPTTPGAYDEDFSGDEYFVSKLDGGLTALLASTFTTPDDAGLGACWGMKCDRTGSICMVGLTGQPDFPTTPNAYDTSFNGGTYDAVIMKLNDDLTTLSYSTFLGGTGAEGATSIAFDEAGYAYLAGSTSSEDFPIPPGAYDDDYNGGYSDCFVAKFRFDNFTRIFEGDLVNDDGFSFGVAWIDYDNDDYLDLFVTNWWDALQRNFLYHNGGDGTFTKVTDDVIAYYGGSLGSTWGDFDDDGDVDVYCANPGYGPAGAPNHFFVNNGDGSFTKVTQGVIVTDAATSTTPAWADYDNDGDLDLFVGGHYFPICLYRNDGTEFTKMNNTEIGLTEDEGNGTWGDCDGDGDLDLLVTRPQLNTNSLFTNNGDGTFTELTSCVIGQDSSIVGSWGDYDNDGDLDLFATYGRNQPNLLYRNVGGGEFIKVTGQDIVTDSGYWSCAGWGDYDNDGNLDLFVTGNYQYTPRLNALWENNGDGTFSKMTGEAVAVDLEASSGAAWGDYDRDGDLDLFVANTNFEDNGFYRNNGNSNNWIDIKCIGTNSNRAAIGAKVRLRAAIDGTPVWQLREISGQSGNHSQNSLNAHFGLGDAAIVDSLKIEWPSGILDVLTGIDINQFLIITETLYGDANGDGVVGPGDVVYLLNYLYRSGSAPDPLWTGDANSDGVVGPGDVVYLINYLFRGGPPPGR